MCHKSRMLQYINGGDTQLIVTPFPFDGVDCAREKPECIAHDCVILIVLWSRLDMGKILVARFHGNITFWGTRHLLMIDTIPLTILVPVRPPTFLAPLIVHSRRLDVP